MDEQANTTNINNYTSKLSEIDIPLSLLLCIILVEGFVTISAEILTIRQLIPVAGNNVVVTSLIIGVFLLFLALGYQRGGNYRSQYIDALKKNFTLAAVIFSFSFSYAFIRGLFGFFEDQIHFNLYATLTIYLLMVTAPLVYILGQTVPITTNLFKASTHVGAISGKVLFLSTIGSFLGAVFTSLVLMNFLGVAWTVTINFILLVILVIVTIKSLLRESLRLSLLLCCALITFALNIAFENKYFITTNDYANYQILKDANISKLGHGNYFIVNDSPSSMLTKDSKSFAYIELMKKIIFDDLKLHNQNILVLGAGGFTLSAEKTQNNQFTYIDIDPKIANIVKSSFNPAIHGSFTANDARVFLLNSKQKYQIIVADTYSNRTTIPFHLLTEEYFLLINHALKDGGLAILNIVANPTFADIYSKAVDNTIRQSFAYCMATPLNYGQPITNIIYVCGKAKHYNEKIYTDDLNSAPFDAKDIS